MMEFLKSDEVIIVFANKCRENGEDGEKTNQWGILSKMR